MLLTMRGWEVWILYNVVACSCFVSLVRRVLLAHAGRLQLSVAVVLLFMELLWWDPNADEGHIAGSFINNPASYPGLGSFISLVCRKYLGSSSLAVATMVVVNVTGRSMKMVPAAGSGAHHRWHLRRSYGAHRQPASMAPAH
jgi:hypothetical protein